MSKKGRSGVMIYFEFRPILKELTLEQTGALLLAILDYAENNMVPDFEDDPMLRLAWACVRDKVDRDAAAYLEKCSRNAYNQYKRWQQEKGLTVLNFDEWKIKVYECTEQYTGEYERIGNIPTPTPTTTPTTTPTATPTPTPGRKSKAEREMDFVASRENAKDLLRGYRG